MERRMMRYALNPAPEPHAALTQSLCGNGCGDRLIALPACHESIHMLHHHDKLMHSCTESH